MRRGKKQWCCLAPRSRDFTHASALDNWFSLARPNPGEPILRLFIFSPCVGVGVGAPTLQAHLATGVSQSVVRSQGAQAKEFGNTGMTTCLGHGPPALWAQLATEGFQSLVSGVRSLSAIIGAHMPRVLGIAGRLSGRGRGSPA